MRGEARVYKDLEALGIAHEVHEHPAVFTVEESRAIKTDIPCLHTKNLFLKDAKGAFFLITVPAEARVDLKSVPSIIASKRLSFGKPDDMERLIGVKPGSVTPLGMINAAPGTITLVLDAALAVSEPVGVHPLRNTATVTLAGADIVRLAEHWGHVPRALPIPKITAG
ncbi:Prolyl-tRNA synthetase associated domain-containing protein [Altererythrobacter insulae]|nr:Prolyl-tRNA synthetase associated domain-containing protein [Altererythrobacter insulae]